MSRSDFVQLLPFDQNREDAIVNKKKLWFEQNLVDQIGVRWIAEALCPTVDHNLPPQYKAPNAVGDIRTLRGWSSYPSSIGDEERRACDSQYDELLMGLHQKMTVLVGHK